MISRHTYLDIVFGPDPLKLIPHAGDWLAETIFLCGGKYAEWNI